MKNSTYVTVYIQHARLQEVITAITTNREFDGYISLGTYPEGQFSAISVPIDQFRLDKIVLVANDTDTSNQKIRCMNAFFKPIVAETSRVVEQDRIIQPDL